MRDKSSDWIGIADFLLCCLGVVIVAVAPTKAKQPSPEMKAEYVIKITWPVTIDADADNWLKTPDGTVFYKDEHRQVGCVSLDMDNHGFEDSKFTMLDGTVQTVDESAEVITLRCKEPGHYDHAVHLYGYVGDQIKTNQGLVVHVEMAALNPSYRRLYEKDVRLEYVKQTVNDFSFDIDRSGALTMSDPPLKWITDFYYHPAAHE